MANTMYFKGEDNLAMRCVVTEYPAIPWAPERGEWQTVLGREGQLWQGEGVADEAPLAVNLWIHPDANLGKVRAWLSGAGELRFGAWDFFVNARINAPITPVPSPFNDGWTMTVTFSVHPALYLYPPDGDVVVTTSGSMIKGRGYAPSKPLITITGNGDITLSIGAKSFFINDLAGSITIDSEYPTAYWGDTLMTGKIDDFNDEWPELNPDYTAISWTGSVSRIVITPRWRVG